MEGRDGERDWLKKVLKGWKHEEEEEEERRVKRGGGDKEGN